MNSDLPVLERKISQALFFNTPSETKEWTKFSYNEAYQIKQAYIDLDHKAWHEAEKINHASRERTKRLKVRNRNMLIQSNTDNLLTTLFLTLTFTDSTLKNTSAITRRKYVSRFLKDNCLEYVANIDFGSKNGREHYHALVLVNGRLDYKKWKYGALNGKKASYFDEDVERLSKYISKLSNHAIKETTHQSRLIYSRNNKRLYK